MTVFKNYRKKPIIIQAIQLTEMNKSQVEEFVGKEMPYHYRNEVDFKKKRNPVGVYLHQTHPTRGLVVAIFNDYIIKDINGLIYPIKPELFEEVYEQV